jgi:hypothetical protein
VAHEYPEAWAPLTTTQSGRCPDIAGAFSDFGAMWDGGCVEGGCRLSFHLFPGKVGGSHVKIMQHGDALLEFQLLRGDELVEERSVSAAKEQFACSGDGLELKRSGHDYTMYSVTRTIFRRGEDRSLIARMERSAAGVAGAAPLPILIPIGFRDSRWIKWEPLSGQAICISRLCVL